jgi:hypothetical protein
MRATSLDQNIGHTSLLEADYDLADELIEALRV